MERSVVQNLYDNFREHVHGESVDKATFMEIMRQSGVENERVADHWFDVCDPNGDGKIVFRCVASVLVGRWLIFCVGSF